MVDSICLAPNPFQIYSPLPTTLVGLKPERDSRESSSFANESNFQMISPPLVVDESRVKPRTPNTPPSSQSWSSGNFSTDPICNFDSTVYIGAIKQEPMTNNDRGDKINIESYSPDITPNNANSAANRHSCQLCQRSFASRDKVRRHFRSVHSADRPFVCSVCGKAFARRDKMHDHARHHSTTKATFPCPVCSEDILSRSLLHRHLREKHQMRIVEATSKLAVDLNATPLPFDSYLSLIPLSAKRSRSRAKSKKSITSLDPASTSPSSSSLVVTSSTSSGAVDTIPTINNNAHSNRSSLHQQPPISGQNCQTWWPSSTSSDPLNPSPISAQQPPPTGSFAMAAGLLTPEVVNAWSQQQSSMLGTFSNNQEQPASLPSIPSPYASYQLPNGVSGHHQLSGNRLIPPLQGHHVPNGLGQPSNVNAAGFASIVPQFAMYCQQAASLFSQPPSQSSSSYNAGGLNQPFPAPLGVIGGNCQQSSSWTGAADIGPETNTSLMAMMPGGGHVSAFSPPKQRIGTGQLSSHRLSNF